MAKSLKKIFSRTPEKKPISPPLFWNSLNGADFADLLRVAESSRFMEMAPPLEHKTNLYISESESPYLIQKIGQMGAQTLVELRSKMKLSPLSIVRSNPIPIRHAIIEADPMALPLKNESADTLLAPIANTNHRLDIFLSEWSRVLKNEGRGVISLMHPSLNFTLKNPNNSNLTSLESYWAQLRQNHFYVEQLIETVVDKNTKPFFVSSNAENIYHEYQGHPLVLTLKVVKYKH